MKLWAIDIRIILSDEEVDKDELQTFLAEVEELVDKDKFIMLACLGVKEARIQVQGEI